MPEPPPGDPTVALEWTEAGISGEAFIIRILATDQGFVAYAFGQDSRARVSGDGIDWTQRDLVFEATTDEFDVPSITAGGPGYVALGSSPEAEDHDLIWTSVDGFAWTSHDLDLKYPDLGVFASVGVESLVGGPNGLVLTGRMDRSEGIDEHRFFVWTSVDGSEWSLAEDAFPNGADIGEILPTGSGFVAEGFVDREDNDERMWVSADGRSWEGLDTNSIDSDWNGGLAVWGDKILAVGETEDGIRLWTSTDGRTWEQLPASSTLDHDDQFNVSVDQVAAGPYGIVLLGELAQAPQPLPQVVIEKDDLIVTIDLETFRLTVTDRSTGNVLLDANPFESDFVIIDEDDGSVTLLDPDTAEVLITITEEDFLEAQAKAYRDAGIEPGFDGEEQPTTAVLWFSPDGRRWTSLDLEETFPGAGIEGFGSELFPSDVVVGNDAVILVWSDRFSEVSEDELEDLPAVIWVGRLTDR